jgi:serine kinase of HPr protein (carbohydrate metabolism regulator)
MTVREIVDKLGLEILTDETNLDLPVEAGYTADLLSDVIGFAPEQSVWVTVQRHINVLGVAKLKNIHAIVIPRNLKVDDEVVGKAKEEGVALLRTNRSAFEISGLLFETLHKGGR